MTGSPELPGLTPKAIDELFRLIEEKSHCVCHVSTYFVELYNDNLCDLYWVLGESMLLPRACAAEELVLMICIPLLS